MQFLPILASLLHPAKNTAKWIFFSQTWGLNWEFNKNDLM